MPSVLAFTSSYAPRSKANAISSTSCWRKSGRMSLAKLGMGSPPVLVRRAPRGAHRRIVAREGFALDAVGTGPDDCQHARGRFHHRRGTGDVEQRPGQVGDVPAEYRL